jgi:MYXO-CTERM domain-containing protein
LTVLLPGDLNVASAVRRTPDGSILLGGLQRVASGDGSVGAVVRIDPDGRLDSTFGDQGVATIDVEGQLDRIGAIESLPDGRVALLLWSRLQYIYYDCSTDQTSLVIVDADGRNSRIESVRQRTSFGGSGCRIQMTLQLDAGGTPLYGNELGIFRGVDALLPPEWRYGPFLLDPVLGSYFTTISSDSINVQRLGEEQPAHDYDLEGIGSALGLCGPVTWTRFVADPARQRLYLGFETDGGQVGVARFLVDGSIDSGWGGNGAVPVGSGRCADQLLEGLASDLRLLSIDPDGSVLVATADGVFRRLAGGLGTTRGAFALREPRVAFAESTASIDITAARLGGSTGAVSVGYRVTACDPAAGLPCSAVEHWGDAMPGEDFVADSGRLQWADGDSGDRTIRVRLLTDGVEEGPEFFYVELLDPEGDADLLNARARILIAGNDAPPTTPPPSVPPPSTGGADGGSGASGPGLLSLLLLGAAALGRRRSTSRCGATARNGP